MKDENAVVTRDNVGVSVHCSLVYQHSLCRRIFPRVSKLPVVFRSAPWLNPPCSLPALVPYAYLQPLASAGRMP